MVGRDKCGPCLLCKKEKRHSGMLEGMRSHSCSSSDTKDAIQYSRASSDRLPSGPMVFEKGQITVVESQKCCWLCLDQEQLSK